MLTRSPHVNKTGLSSESRALCPAPLSPSLQPPAARKVKPGGEGAGPGHVWTQVFGPRCPGLPSLHGQEVLEKS